MFVHVVEDCAEFPDSKLLDQGLKEGKIQH
jgi:hypothetical protein